jgi:hypothetical protein
VAKKSTLRKVTETVKDAAAAVVHAAEDHVVQPVGKALGLVKEEPPKSKSAIKAARKQLVRSLTEKKRRLRPVGMQNTGAKSEVPTGSGNEPNGRGGTGKGR